MRRRGVVNVARRKLVALVALVAPVALVPQVALIPQVALVAPVALVPIQTQGSRESRKSNPGRHKSLYLCGNSPFVPESYIPFIIYLIRYILL